MQTRHYRLGNSISSKRILKDIELMIKEHSKLNNLDDTILTIELKDVSYTYDLGTKKFESKDE